MKIAVFYAGSSHFFPVATFTDAQHPINEALMARLRAAGCVRGHFEASSAAPPYVLTGEDAAGQFISLPVSDADVLLQHLVRGYFKTYYSAGYARLLITLDVSTGQFMCTLRTPAQEAAQVRMEAQLRAAGRQAPPRHRAPYGAVLAGLVADALSQGRTLLPYHRDYCGMGLECSGGYYRYGEAWDGRYLEAQLIFSSREDFVNWLAAQSNKSLARLEETDPWYWHNQTITRQQLQELVRNAIAEPPPLPNGNS
jgi:hypothetical protein